MASRWCWLMQQMLHSEGWLGKISARDFVGGSRKATALDLLVRCKQAYTRFATCVYAQQGIAKTDDTES